MIITDSWFDSNHINKAKKAPIYHMKFLGKHLWMRVETIKKMTRKR